MMKLHRHVPMSGRIAILGATSHLAGNLAVALADHPASQITLFSRTPPAVEHWAHSIGLSDRLIARDYRDFGAGTYDAIINFVGAGDPARRAAAGAEIVDVTLRFDELALSYVRSRPDCRYIFMSSGAAYGGSFVRPAVAAALLEGPATRLRSTDWYGAAKWDAECRHRAEKDLPIVDIRVFSYFSRKQPLTGRFLVCDILRAIRHRSTLQTSDQPIVRDYLHPSDLRALVGAVLASPPANCAVDAYTLAPVGKLEMLDAMHYRFGLDYRLHPATQPGDGERLNYYSLDRQAATFGYQPTFDSLRCILEEAAALLAAECNTLVQPP